MSKYALLCLLLFIKTAGAQDFVLPQPSNFEKVDFYLHTIDLGPMLYMKFGHTALLVDDKSNGNQYVFNWGVFSFSDPLFAWRFYRGERIYHLGIYSLKSAVRQYEYEERRVWQDKFVFNVEQKKQLFALLVENAKAENRHYPYDFFYDNCSTRLRDMIDKVLGGKLFQKYSQIDSQFSFRDLIRTHMSSSPFLQMGLDILINADADKKITAWEEMFLPASLQKYFAAMEVIDSSGQETVMATLLGNNQVLYDFPLYQYHGLKGEDYLLIFMGIPLMWAALLLVYNNKKVFYLKRGLRVLGGATIMWSLLGAVLGTLMIVNLFLAGDHYLKSNVNMLLFWPFDWLYLYLGSRLLRYGQALPAHHMLNKTIAYIALFHLAFALIAIFISVLGIVDQKLDRIVLYFIPFLILLNWLIYKYGTEKLRNRAVAE